MRKLNKYLVKDYLTIFSMALLLMTFAMCIGAIYKVIDYMARGLSIDLVFKFFIYNIPYSLAFAIPISALFSTLLLFGRLSSDSEISALKSSGLSMWQMVSPIILISIFMTVVCLYINCVVYPATTYANRKLIKGMGVEEPINLLEEGRFIRDFPGYMLYVGKKQKNKVKDLIAYELGDGGVQSSIRAASGVMSTDKERNLLKIDLYDVRIEVPDPKHPNDSTKARYINAKSYPIRINIDELMGEKNVSKKRKNMSIFELIYRIRNVDVEYAFMHERDRRIEKVQLLVEANTRICLALACFTFVLIAIPLGIRSHRKESSIGMVISLIIVFAFYFFIILADALCDYPQWHPQYFLWIPIVGGQLGGILLLRRAN
ncbi:MAG: LptF/LptG family permease [Kiritimatiellales bacterium]|nr:LptF/LptG family permease [Kiritimatiellales bacterium]